LTDIGKAKYLYTTVKEHAEIIATLLTKVTGIEHETRKKRDKRPINPRGR